MTMYDCPRCGRERLVCWDARAGAFLCLSRPNCGFAARVPGGARGHDRGHVAELISRGGAEVPKAWMEAQR